MIPLRTAHAVLVVLVTVAVYPECARCAESSDDNATARGSRLPTVDELLLFFPSKYPDGDWTPAGLRFVDVYFSAEDDTRLHGWYCPCEKPRATILIAHGNGGNVASHAFWLRYLQSKLRVSTFLFDYRGYGRSEGVPTVQGALLDARAARGKLRELAGVEDSEMLLMGESLGGAIVVQLAAESPPRGLILQSSFSSLKDVAEVHYPKLSWLVPPAKLDSVSQIAKYHGPLLQSHGTADRTIPIASGEKLFRAANEPKTFVAIAEADHNDWPGDSYLARLDAFVDELDSSIVHETAEPPSDGWLVRHWYSVLAVAGIVAAICVAVVFVVRRARRRGRRGAVGLP